MRAAAGDDGPIEGRYRRREPGAGRAERRAGDLEPEPTGQEGQTGAFLPPLLKFT